MRNYLRNHKKWSALSAIALLSVGGALAFYIATGSGTATGKASSTAPTVTLAGVVASEVGPGGSSAVALSATNAGSAAAQVGTVAGVVSVDSAHASAGCLAAWFSFTGATEDFSVPTGTSALPKAGSLAFVNEPINQSACEGATLTVALTS
jgi:hypothetical protein